MTTNARNFNRLLICATCLSQDRKLIAMRDSQACTSSYLELSLKLTDRICWECHNFVRRMVQFKSRARMAQACLWNMANGLVQELPSLSRMTASSGVSVDIPPDITASADVKIEPQGQIEVTIKREVDEDESSEASTSYQQEALPSRGVPLAARVTADAVPTLMTLAEGNADVDIDDTRDEDGDMSAPSLIPSINLIEEMDEIEMICTSKETVLKNMDANEIDCTAEETTLKNVVEHEMNCNLQEITVKNIYENEFECTPEEIMMKNMSENKINGTPDEKTLKNMDENEINCTPKELTPKDMGVDEINCTPEEISLSVNDTEDEINCTPKETTPKDMDENEMNCTPEEISLSVNDIEDEINCTPEEIPAKNLDENEITYTLKEYENEITYTLKEYDGTSAEKLPEKSRHLYNKTYENFMVWKLQNKMSSFSEEIFLSYFQNALGKYKPTSLWTEYSKLKSTMSIYHQVDMSKYTKLQAYLNGVSKGFEAKKARTFTSEELNKFIDEAPDWMYLLTKVAVIFGIVGACTRQQLYKLKKKDVVDTQNALIVHIRNRKNKCDRSFAITDKFYDICKKYIDLRPTPCKNTNFFIRYVYGKCRGQTIGIHAFGQIGKTVAAYLTLDHPELYTGHCFKRTSALVGLAFDDLITGKMQANKSRITEPVKCTKQPDSKQVKTPNTPTNVPSSSTQVISQNAAMHVREIPPNRPITIKRSDIHRPVTISKNSIQQLHLHFHK